jgi:hypothetical protein
MHRLREDFGLVLVEYRTTPAGILAARPNGCLRRSASARCSATFSGGCQTTVLPFFDANRRRSCRTTLYGHLAEGGKTDRHRPGRTVQPCAAVARTRGQCARQGAGARLAWRVRCRTWPIRRADHQVRETADGHDYRSNREDLRLVRRHRASRHNGPHQHGPIGCLQGRADMPACLDPRGRDGRGLLEHR